MKEQLNALSPLDGRYASKSSELRHFFSESALQKYRIRIEIEWLIYLCNVVKLDGLVKLKSSDIKFLKDLYIKFDDNIAKKIKEIESVTNHDVKAIEYYIREALPKSLKPLSEFIHFGCTSEDINNLSHALSLKEYMEQLHISKLCDIDEALSSMADKFADVAMLARTHGQPASPTTMGKEILVFVLRLKRQMNILINQEYLGKFSGAVGNFNAHIIAYPYVDWISVSQNFIELLGLTYNPVTTQIEPHDYMAELFDTVKRINTICINISRDFWSYISYNYFTQTLKKGEIGSSTMPHKVNPIDFENCEGNMGLSNALLSHLSEKLPISRMQRDLTDSTVLRNMGSAFAYSYIALESLLKGLNKLCINKATLEADLMNHTEVLAEALQTVMRKHKTENAYEKMKELTRGKHIEKEDLKKFISTLKLPSKESKMLEQLAPDTYIGLAKELVKKFNK